MEKAHSLIKDHTKLSKGPFIASGIPSQQIFIPMLFPSPNEYLRMATSSYAPGKKNQRSSGAQSLKTSMETKVQVHMRLAKLKPMEHAFFFFTFYELGRQRNKDNIMALALKFFFDALQKAEIVANDGWKEIVAIDPHFEVTKESAGMLVRMYDPFQCEAEIIHEAFTNVRAKLDQYKDFRKRTGR